MDHEKVIELINKTRIKADEAIDAILKTQTKQDFIEYYEKLRQRVKYSNIVIVKASHAKLMRFPNIGGAAGSGLVVFGSNARMVALWSHVFSLRNK
jgi:hypothetical protein